MAAFKRAQAHQRRGSVDTQQQPVLAVKIELEQLVVSILDDPSVSRVMREAGFSSTQIKANVEQTVCSSTAATSAPPRQNPNPSSSTATTTSKPQETTKAKLPLPGQARDEDVAVVLDCLASSARSKRRVVVVAESTESAEATVRAVVDKVKKADQSDALPLRGAQVVSLRVSSFRDMPREEAERRLSELRCLVKSRGHGGHVLLVVEDLKWAAEFWAGRRPGYYCAVEHVVTEVRALACGGGGEQHALTWLVGFGTYQTYTKCRTGQPSLESLWGLQTLTVPAGCSLALSLTTCPAAFDDSALGSVNQSMKASSDTDGVPRWPLSGGGQLISRCCGDCSAARTDTKAALPPSFLSSSSIPSWLQHCRDQEPTHLMDLGRNWGSICGKPSQRMTLHFSAPVSPASSISSYEHGHQPRHSWLLADLDCKHPWKPKREADVEKVLSHDSGASNGSVEVECRSRFKELNAENLKVLCVALEKEVPWQKEIAPEIASTVLQCRSGISKRRDKSRSTDAKEETWMFFLGGDVDGKEKVARELANLVFGSHKNFMSIKPAGASSPSASCSTEEHRSKRPRTSAAATGACLEQLYEAINENPHRVIILEDIEQADQYSQVAIKEAIDTGVVRSQASDEVGLGDAIVILCCESFDAKSRTCSPPSKQIMAEPKEEHTSDNEHKEVGASSSSGFDLNRDIESEHADHESNPSDVCLLTAVDRTLFFRTQEDL